MQNLETEEIFSHIQHGVMPDLRILARGRISGNRGNLVLGELYPQLIAQGLPKGDFRTYLSLVHKNTQSLMQRNSAIPN